MSAIILFILPSSALLYVAQLFYVYSVIFGRAELDLLSSQAYQAFDYFSQMYAEKSVN